VFTLPAANVSNPSDLAFGGRLPDGRLRLWTVCDGSAITRDHLPRDRVVVQLLVDPSGSRPLEALPLTLDPRLAVCDLEGIAVDPADGGLVVADERVDHEPSCGGTGPGGAAPSQLFKIDVTGRLMGGPWDTDILNTGNNGIEGLAIRQVEGSSQLFAFEEKKDNAVPKVAQFRLEPGQNGSPHRLEPVRTFHLDVPPGATQTGAVFRTSDQRLMVVDRDGLALLEVDLDACADQESVTCLRKASIRALTIDRLQLVTPNSDRNRLGLVEGITFDDVGAMYLILDNNGAAFPNGDRSPRMVRLLPLP